MLRNLCWLFIAVTCWAAPLRADDGQEAAPKTNADLVKQLDAEDFAARQAASVELTARGKDALPALVEAATGASAEAATRALDILRQHHEGSNGDLQGAAKEALQKLAAGDGPAARRAGEILTPKPMPPQGQAGIALRPGIRVAPGAFRIAVAGGAVGGGKRMTFKDVNGVKEVEVVEGDRTTKIEEDPAKGIKVAVTDKKDGKDETKTYEAKNAEELKEKHPEAHKLYEQYAKRGAGGEIRIDGVRIGVAGDGAAGIRRIDPPAIVRDPRALVERLDKTQKQLEEAAGKLKKLAEDPAHAADIRGALDAIEASKKELDEVKAQFPLR